MSFVALAGNPSGTGTLTVSAPNTNSNRALALPDASGIIGLGPQLQAAVTLTSQGQVDFTGIPSWAQRIRLLLDAVSTSGTAGFLIRLGTGGVPKATGYTSTSIATTSTNAVLSSGIVTGFNVYGSATTDSVDGVIDLQRISGNKWVSTHVGTRSGWGVHGGGTVTLSGPLDMVRIIPGSGTFDAGSLSLSWE